MQSLWHILALATAVTFGAHSVYAQTAGDTCSVGDVSGPDALGNNLICSGGVFVSAGGYGGSGSATDRISTSNVASGATLGMVVADKGTVSFTTGGVAGTAYLDTTGRWIGPGVSITTNNGISSTNGYFSGNVGLGTNTPSSSLHIYGYTSSPVTLTVHNGYNNVTARTRLELKNYTGEAAYIDSGYADYAMNIVAGRNNFGTISLKTLVGGAEQTRMFIANAGNVGIGTTSPQATLQVSGSFTVSTSAQTTTPTLYIASNGLIGIGNSNPSYHLDISGTHRLFLYSNSTGYVQPYSLAVTNNAAGTNYSRLFMGQISTNKMFIEAADQSNTKGSLLLQPYGGNVGIGTGSPAYQLSIVSASGTTGTVLASLSSDDTWHSAFVLANTSTNGHTYHLLSGGTNNTNIGAGGFGIYDGTSATTRLAISSGGNVGIGTTAPSGTLWVSGTVGMTRYGAAPVACGATYNGLMAMTSTARLCACDGTSWKYADSTGTACSW